MALFGLISGLGGNDPNLAEEADIDAMMDIFEGLAGTGQSTSAYITSFRTKSRNLFSFTHISRPLKSGFGTKYHVTIIECSVTYV